MNEPDERCNLKFSLVVPVFNEEKILPETLMNLDAFQKKLTLGGMDEVEIIIVNDGSTDDSGKIIEEYIQSSACGFKFICNSENLGYGATLKNGILHSFHDTIGIIDCDGTYRISQLEELIEGYKSDSDIAMIVGDRHSKGTGHIPLLRKPPKWVLKKLSEYTVGKKIPDLNSGLRLIRKDLVYKFFTLLPDGFSFTTTITLALLSNKYMVKYHPIDYDKRIGKSSIRPIYDTLGFFQLIIRTILYFNPLRIFAPISAICMGASFVVAIGSYLYTPQMMDVTTIVLFFSSLNFLGIGMLADIMVKHFRTREPVRTKN